jgi:type VII secretion-associated serine protease mycosin
MASFAARACQLQEGPTKLTGIPWPQQRFDFPRLWQVTRGAGVTVAVVDSGVDAGHPQLAGKVTSIDITKTGPQDCLGHGTGVAGIIGAGDMRTSNRPFVGIAPEAKIVSVKYTNQQHSSGADPNLAKAIRKAATVPKVKVINVSATAPHTADLQAAVKFAQSRDILVVAAAGNVEKDQRGTQGPAYPAGYNGVVGVAAVGQDGQITDFSNTATQIAVAAPGKDIPTLWPHGQYNPAEQGTSFAAPFVAGLAALVRARYPGLNYQQVARRIEVTAEGSSGVGTGRGMINPYGAITAEISYTAPDGGVPRLTAQPVRIDPPPPMDTHTRSIALTVTFCALGIAALVAVASIVIPLGRRRGWRPGRATIPPE